MAAGTGWFIAAGVLGLTHAGIKRLLDRRRSRAWEREWARVGRAGEPARTDLFASARSPPVAVHLRWGRHARPVESNAEAWVPNVMEADMSEPTVSEKPGSGSGARDRSVAGTARGAEPGPGLDADERAELERLRGEVATLRSTRRRRRTGAAGGSAGGRFCRSC